MADVPDHAAVASPGYAAAKLAALARKAPRFPSLLAFSFAPRGSDRVARRATEPLLRGDSFDGISREAAGNNIPPDPNGAVDQNYFVEMTNRHFDAYRKSDHADLDSRSLADLFLGYTGATLFDPRVLRDPWTGRWIFISAALHEPGTGQQRLQLAVSTTSDPISPRCIYPQGLNVNYSGDDFFDFPKLGVSEDAVLISGNVFNRAETVQKGSTLLAIPKSQLYACAGLNYTIFSGFSWNLTPPIQYDQNASTFFVGAPYLDVNVPGQLNSALPLWAGQHLGQPGSATLTLQGNVAVPTYQLPAAATQCGQGQRAIDTFDTRFVHSSAQWGNSLWNTHTTSLDSVNTIATPRWYDIDTPSVSVAQTGQYFSTGSSSDWNASMAVNAGGEVFVTWTSNDTTPCTGPQVQFSGRQPTDVPEIFPNLHTLWGSATDRYNHKTDQPDELFRWGDYSAVSLDPSVYGGCAANRRAWIVNEYALAPKFIGSVSQTPWATRIGRIGFC